MIYPSWMKGSWDDEVSLAKDIWLAHLKKIQSESNDQERAALIAQAVDQAIDRFPSHPPTLGEFKKLLAVRPEHQLVKLAVIEPSKNPEIGKAAMQAIKDLVGKKKV